MDNKEDFFKNYRGRYSQYWIERWGLIPELPTSFDNANSIYEFLAWLQRAFKMAGVKNIIMSLWKVPDAQTAELFEVFYAECFKGKTIPEAFREAQNKMKTKYAPYYWAGFVLLE